MELPKTLVISSAFFSDKNNNGKTLSSFFFGYPSDKLSQLAFTVSPNNSAICKRYYALTITDVIKGKLGKEYPASVGSDNPSEVKRNSLMKKVFHYFSEKRLPITILLKNYIWSFYNCRGIYEYIESIKPDVVFFQGFSLSYGYKIVLDICERYHLPMVLELTDDYTARLYPKSIIDYLNHREYEYYFEKAIRYSSSVIVISPKMKQEYEKRYGKTMIEMMNSVSPIINSNYERDNHLFVYAGNVKLNRWKVLIEFAKAIHKIDSNNILFICTPDVVSDTIIKAFAKCPSIKYGGSLTAIELEELFVRCSYVVHVEAFDRTNREITRYSISTKIPEYMASGALLIAIGPNDIASMEYISDENIGICINSTSANDIYNELIGTFNDTDLMRNIKEQAQKVCYRNHSKEKNAVIIKKLLLGACDELIKDRCCK